MSGHTHIHTYIHTVYIHTGQLVTLAAHARRGLIIEQCHKLLLVSGGGLALTRSYSERWQVARIGLCGLGAVCGVLKI